MIEPDTPCHCPHVFEEHRGPGGACIGTVIEFGCEVHCRCVAFEAVPALEAWA